MSWIGRGSRGVGRYLVPDEPRIVWDFKARGGTILQRAPTDAPTVSEVTEYPEAPPKRKRGRPRKKREG